MKRHYVVTQLPWYEFMIGTLCYIGSVCLVTWLSLEIDMGARVITLSAGLCACMIIFYICGVIWYDSE